MKKVCIVCGRTYFTNNKQAFNVCKRKSCKDRLKKCPTCGTFFIAKDEREIYCKDSCMPGVMTYKEVIKEIDFTKRSHLCAANDGSPDFNKELFELKMSKVQLGIANKDDIVMVKAYLDNNIFIKD